jgi:hypothetical protein
VIQASGRYCIEDVVRNRCLLFRVHNIDDRRLTRDRDRLRYRADFQLDVDLGGKRSGQLDAFALHGAESGQRERDAVRARAKIFDAVLTAAVSHSGASALDERGAGRFDGHAGEHGAGRVLDHAGDRRLGKQRRRSEDEKSENRERQPNECAHQNSPSQPE